MIPFGFWLAVRQLHWDAAAAVGMVFFSTKFSASAKSKV
jgi:hypothetical protein